MRNLDECKAEILRLGNKKIKERKKRRIGVLSVCVPLCLCVVVASVTILPSMFSTNSDAPVYGVCAGGMCLESAESTEGNYTQVSIKGFGGISLYQQVDEPIRTIYAANLINEFYTENSDGSTGGTLNENQLSQDGQPEFNENEPLEGYLISFTMEDGLKIEYTLSGYTLTNKSSGKSVIITIEQKNQLLEVFR